MTGRVLPVQLALDGHRSVLVDGELPSAIGGAVDGERHLTLSALIGIGGAEGLQTPADLGVLVDGRFDVGLVEERLVVVDVAQLDVDPAVGHVVLVVVVVLALVVDLDHEPEAVALQFVLVVERLDDFQRAGAVIVAHHRELVSTESTALDHLHHQQRQDHKQKSNVSSK